MRERWIIALGVLYFVIILAGALFAGLTVFQAIGQIPQRFQLPTNSTPTYPYSHSTPWPPYGSNYTIRSIPASFNATPLYEGEYKPYITAVNLTAQDHHSNMNGGMGSLHIGGVLNNTGGGTAYNLVLHVVAIDAEGKTKSWNYDLAGITAHMTLGMGKSLNYNGSALTSCTITPTYLDKVGMLNQAPINNASALEH